MTQKARRKERDEKSKSASHIPPIMINLLDQVQNAPEPHPYPMQH